MFAAALRESEARDRAQRERERAEQAHAAALETARREVDQAIESIRAAKRSGASTTQADATWRAAKARLLELETGTAPSWAPPPIDTDEAPAIDSGDAGDDGEHGGPRTDDAQIESDGTAGDR